MQTQHAQPVLDVRHISKHFGGVWAVKDFSATLKEHDIVSIIGPNGSGKTTVFNLITGVYPVDGGAVLLQNAEITNFPQHRVTRQGIARTFQNIRLFQGLSVLENVMTAHDPHSHYHFFDAIFLSGRKRRIDAEVRERCLDYVHLVGLDAVKHDQPGNLPYGSQRKLEIARALATEPKILLLDEPAAGLNPSEVRDFIDLIYKLHEQFKLSIILIEHRMQVVMEMSRWIYVMDFGEVLAEGKPEEIQNNPEVARAYIGEEET